jgi:hypothetical protein
MCTACSCTTDTAATPAAAVPSDGVSVAARPDGDEVA